MYFLYAMGSFLGDAEISLEFCYSLVICWMQPPFVLLHSVCSLQSGAFSERGALLAQILLQRCGALAFSGVAVGTQFLFWLEIPHRWPLYTITSSLTDNQNSWDVKWRSFSLQHWWHPALPILQFQTFPVWSNNKFIYSFTPNKILSFFFLIFFKIFFLFLLFHSMTQFWISFTYFLPDICLSTLFQGVIWGVGMGKAKILLWRRWKRI